jgi:hypothetical protein
MKDLSDTSLTRLVGYIDRYVIYNPLTKVEVKDTIKVIDSEKSKVVYLQVTENLKLQLVNSYKIFGRQKIKITRNKNKFRLETIG